MLEAEPAAVKCQQDQTTALEGINDTYPITHSAICGLSKSQFLDPFPSLGKIDLRVAAVASANDCLSIFVRFVSKPLVEACTTKLDELDLAQQFGRRGMYVQRSVTPSRTWGLRSSNGLMLPSGNAESSYMISKPGWRAWTLAVRPFQRGALGLEDQKLVRTESSHIFGCWVWTGELDSNYG